MAHVPDAAFLDHALEVALTAARAAGARIMRHFGSAVAVEIKPDASPVTIADREAEDVIRDSLQRAFPDHAILGEERGRTGGGEFLWLVDPLDGTKSFVRGTPFFSTQIALMHAGELLVGVSHAPAYGETMWARRAGGALLDGKRVRVADTGNVRDAALSLGNIASLAGDARGWDALGGMVREVNRVRGYGDFCHYHQLSRGALDIVIESDVNILDVAALAVIVSEAGGKFTDLDGLEPTLGIRSVLAATPALHAAVRKRFSGSGMNRHAAAARERGST
ncbi:MAG: inositol monophosphatase family protein [Rhodanobacteraceae bacterium]